MPKLTTNQDLKRLQTCQTYFLLELSVFFTKVSTSLSGLRLVNGSCLDNGNLQIKHGFNALQKDFATFPREKVQSMVLQKPNIRFKRDQVFCERCNRDNSDHSYEKNGNSFKGQTSDGETCVLSLQSWMYAGLYRSSCPGKGTKSAPRSLGRSKQTSEFDKYEENTDISWKQNIKHFESSKKVEEKEKNLTKSLRSFYKQQNRLIESYVTLRDNQPIDHQDASINLIKKTEFCSKLTFLANVVLLIAKTTAAVMSGSIAIISSLVDSVVDLASGIVIWVTSWAIRNGDPYTYPQGRKRLEPLAIIILSVIMGIASLQLIKESVTKIIGLANGSQYPPIVDVITICISAGTVVIKLVLFLLCKKIHTPAVRALAQDHRNDVVSNSIAILCGYLGSKDFLQYTGVPEVAYIDPVGAISISIYIAATWYIMGRDQTKVITGMTASPEFLSKITWICLNHHREIRYVTSVKAVHSGYNFIVEVSILFPGHKTLTEVYGIGEALKTRLERMAEVDKAFVHVDCSEQHDDRPFESECTHL